MEGGRREGGWAVATVTHLPKGSPCGKPARDAAVVTAQPWGHPLHGSPIPSAQPSTPGGIACVDRREEEEEAGPGVTGLLSARALGQASQPSSGGFSLNR